VDTTGTSQAHQERVIHFAAGESQDLRRLRAKGFPVRDIPELARVSATDEFLVFKVDSLTKPGVTYRVDKSLWYGSGACSCEQFCCRIQPHLGRGDWTPPTTCKHLNLVDRYIGCEVARRAIDQRKDGKQYCASEPNL
jgi:hypothetical protein